MAFGVHTVEGVGNLPLRVVFGGHPEPAVTIQGNSLQVKFWAARPWRVILMGVRNPGRGCGCVNGENGRLITVKTVGHRIDGAAFAGHHPGDGPPAKQLAGPGRGEHGVLGRSFAQLINHDMGWRGSVLAAVHLVGGDQQVTLGDGHKSLRPIPEGKSCLSTGLLRLVTS